MSVSSHSANVVSVRSLFPLVCWGIFISTPMVVVGEGAHRSNVFFGREGHILLHPPFPVIYFICSYDDYLGSGRFAAWD